MTATIDKNGMLVVQAETELEAYALMMWSNEKFGESSKIAESMLIKANVKGDDDDPNTNN